MVIHDGIIKWWVQNVLSKRMTKYEPGFIVTEFSSRYGNAFQRIIILPEDILVEIEKQVVEKHGEKGEEVLKKIGREYGYNFAYTLGAPTIDKGKEFIEKFLRFSVNYGLGSLAREVKLIELDIKNGRFGTEFNQRVICRKNGIGHLLDYTVMGFMEYALKRSLKIVESKCQGRGDAICRISLEYDYGDLPKLHFNPTLNTKYRKFNEIRPIHYSAVSMSGLLKDKIVKLEEDFFVHNNQVIIFFESGLLYLINHYLQNELSFKENLFDIGLNGINGFIENYSITKVGDMLSSWGYGDYLYKKNNGKPVAYLTSFPWYPLLETQDFPLLRGMLSAFLLKDQQDVRFSNTKLVSDVDKITLVFD